MMRADERDRSIDQSIKASGDDAGLLQPLPDAGIPALLAPQVLVGVGLGGAGSGGGVFGFAWVEHKQAPGQHQHTKALRGGRGGEEGRGSRCIL